MEGKALTSLFNLSPRQCRVGFAYDVFRAPALGQWDASLQARWLQAFLTPAIAAAGGSVENALAGVAAEAGAWAAGQVAAQALPPGAAGWAKLYGGEAPDGTDQWFGPMLGYDLLVGYELSANQIRFLARHDAPFLDIGIDAVRFARRTLFRARSNSRAVRHALHRYHVPDQALAADAGFLAATCGGGGGGGGAGPAEDLVMVGQVDVDTSLIVGGEIQRIDPHLPRLAELAAQHRRVLVCPHPLANENRDAAAVLSAIPNSVLGEGPVYPIVLAARTRTVATLSSSVATEAALLGRAVVRLIEPDGSGEALGAGVVSPCARLDSTLAQACFWTAALRCEPQHGLPFPGYGPDEAALRSALGIFAATPMMTRPLPVLAPGAVVALSDPATAHLCRLGWSGVEPSGRWTDGPVATLAFEAQEAGAGLHLVFYAFIGQGPRRLGLRLLLTPASGPAVEQAMSFTAEGPHEVRLLAPLPGGLTRLKLSMDTPCSPLSQGISPDPRRLGVLVQTMGFLAAPGA